MRLIAGLGNPEDRYKNTRHNIGFMVLDSYIQHRSETFKYDKKLNAKITKINNAILIQPQTYMNLSGVSVREVREFYKIDNSEILVIHDDLDLKFGTLRFKCGGSSGGHNGIKSIDTHIGGDYIRARLGIGRPQKIELESSDKTQGDIISYVLESFNKTELESLSEVFTIMQNVIDSFINGENIYNLQNKYTRNV